MVNPWLYNLGVSADNLMEFTKNIAQWERVSGTEDEMRAFLYIENELKQLGADTKIHKHNAFISVPKEAELEVAGQSYPCRTHSLVPSTGENGLQKRLVYGGRPDQLTSELCKDCIVMIDGPADEEPLVIAQQMGAVGVVFTSGDYIHEMCISPVWGSPSHANKHLLFNIPVASVTTTTGIQIKGLLINGSAEAKMTTSVDSCWRDIPLLVAEIKALGSTDNYVMFSGHVDSWYFGAMDNGTANATMMEIGRIAVKERKELHHNLRLVFFSGHSQGRYAGSSWYFDHFWEDIHRNCIVSINVDSLGGRGANDLTRSTIMPEAKGVASEIIKELTGVTFVGSRYNRFADQSFWGAGVSCAFASFSKQTSGSLGLGWWWHTTEDTIDKIDRENLLRDARIFAAYVMHFLTSRVVPLDFQAAALEILGILQDWQSKADKYFDLSEAIERAKQLSARMNELYEHIPDETNDEAVEAFNTTLWKIGRILVPLNYTQGFIYQNDPGLPQPPMPSLAAINSLVSADDDGRKELVVELVRRRNYVLHSLALSLEAIKVFHTGLETNKSAEVDEVSFRSGK